MSPLFNLWGQRVGVGNVKWNESNASNAYVGFYIFMYLFQQSDLFVWCKNNSCFGNVSIFFIKFWTKNILELQHTFLWKNDWGSKYNNSKIQQKENYIRVFFFKKKIQYLVFSCFIFLIVGSVAHFSKFNLRNNCPMWCLNYAPPLHRKKLYTYTHAHTQTHAHTHIHTYTHKLQLKGS